MGVARGGKTEFAGGRRIQQPGGQHTAIDDRTRVAYSEILDDEQGTTAAGFWRRARLWFASYGIIIERCLTDNGACYRTRAWAAALAETNVAHKRTRPYRHQTNGKVERFHRTMAAEWAFARHYRTEADRRRALPGWLHTYNHHRLHSAIGGHPPITRLTNVPGQYI